MSSGDQVHILLVDDRPANLVALEATLGDLGAVLVRAGSGEEALKRLLDRDFAAVLLDVQMPGMSGFEVAKLIRSRPRSAHTPVIFLSAHEDPAFPVEEAYSLGAVDFLFKPFVPAILRAKVTFFVDFFRKSEQLKEAQARRVAESKAWVRTVTDSLPVLIGYIDREHRYQFVNRAYEEWFGLPPGAGSGRSVREMLGEDVYGHRRPYLEAALRGEVVRFDGPTRHHTRGLIETENTYTPHVAGSEVRGLFVLVQDVTERRRTEARYKAVVDTSLDCVIGMDHEGRVTEFNPAAERAFRYRREEAVGREMGELIVPPEHRDGHREGLRRYLESGVDRVLGRRLELPALRKGGERFLAELSITRNAGEPPTFTGFLRDITEQRRAETRLRESEARFRFLDSLGVETRSLTEPGAIMAVTARLLGEHLKVTRCAYADVEPDNDRFTIRSDWTDGAPSTAGTYSLDLFGSRAAADMRGGRTLVISDVDAELAPSNGADTFNAIGIKAIVCCPLVKGGRLVAMMAVHHATRRDWTGAEVALVEAVVERSWAHIERVRSEAASVESEARFRQLAETIPQLAWMARPDGHIFWYNRRWYEYTGTTPEQMEGWGWQSVHDPDVLPAVVGQWTRSIETGEPFDMTFPLKGGDGVLRPFLTRVNPLRDGAGRIVLWFGTNTDISELMRAEAAVRESESRLADVFRLAPSLMVVLRGPEHVFERVSDRYAEMVGGRELVGRPVREALPELIDQGYVEMLDRVYRTGEPFVADGMPARMQYRPGQPPEERFFDFVYQPFRDPAGEVAGIIAQGIDVTDKKRAEDRLAEQYRRKDQFIAMLAHELRNPLAPIRNAVAILGLRQDTAAVAKAREIIGRQTEHLAHIVDDLLEVSRLNRGKVQLRRERVELGRVVRVAAADQAHAFQASGVALVVDVPETPIWAEGDRTRLSQVLTNLLANAAKFTERGQVTVCLRSDGGRATLTVADTGAGVSADLLPRLFEPFTQADETLERTQGGLGLGLALVKGLVELHGGTVAAESPGPGRGATFTVTLPVIAEPPAVSTPLEAPTPIVGQRRLKVLIVEDNRDSADSLKMLLEICGCEVHVAYTGPDGVAAAVREEPDLVLCDIGLPGMNGYDVARRIKSDLHGRKPVLVALTGYGEEDDRRRAKDAGFDRHFTKPVDPAAIEQLLVASH